MCATACFPRSNCVCNCIFPTFQLCLQLHVPHIPTVFATVCSPRSNCVCNCLFPTFQLCLQLPVSHIPTVFATACSPHSNCVCNCMFPTFQLCLQLSVPHVPTVFATVCSPHSSKVTCWACSFTHIAMTELYVCRLFVVPNFVKYIVCSHFQVRCWACIIRRTSL